MTPQKRMDGSTSINIPSSRSTTTAAIVNFNGSIKNCFVTLSSATKSSRGSYFQRIFEAIDSDDIMKRVICIEKVIQNDAENYDSKTEQFKYFFSLSASSNKSKAQTELVSYKNNGSLHHDSNESFLVISMNNKLGRSLGFSNQEKVLLSSSSGIPSLEKVWIEPTLEDDWEILEINGSKIETDLLNQLRVIQYGLSYVIHASNLPISVTVVSFLPKDLKVGILQQHTELHIGPKERLGAEQPVMLPDSSRSKSTYSNAGTTIHPEASEKNDFSTNISSISPDKASPSFMRNMFSAFSTFFTNESGESTLTMNNSNLFDVKSDLLLRTWRVVPMQNLDGDFSDQFCCFASTMSPGISIFKRDLTNSNYAIVKLTVLQKDEGSQNKSSNQQKSSPPDFNSIMFVSKVRFIGKAVLNNSQLI